MVQDKRTVSLKETLGSEAWMRENAGLLASIFDTGWVEIETLNINYVGFHLKLYGVDWRSLDDLVRCMVLFERTGIIERVQSKIRRGCKYNV